jgi:branched-chain amino acid transport system ATP-binding protein
MIAATQGADLSGHAAETQCLEVLEQTGLMGQANTLAGKLRLLDRKRLELTRALCARPRLLMLDEIAGGLTEHECVSLVETIKEIHASGVSIIWIEHVVHALLAVVDRLIVIDFGKKIAEGDPKTIMESPEVQEIYLGIEIDA